MARYTELSQKDFTYKRIIRLSREKNKEKRKKEEGKREKGKKEKEKRKKKKGKRKKEKRGNEIDSIGALNNMDEEIQSLSLIALASPLHDD